MTTATSTITDGTKPHMVTRKTKGLGRGLDALLGGSAESSDADGAAASIARHVKGSGRHILEQMRAGARTPIPADAG